MKALSSILLFACFLALACTSTEPTVPTDTTTTQDISNDSSVDDVATEDSQAPPSCKEDALPSDFIDLSFRFTTFEVSEPTDDDGVIKDLLNALWVADIENDLLNLVFVLGSHDDEAKTITFLGGGAFARDADGNLSSEEAYTGEGSEYYFEDGNASEFPMQMDGCQLESTDESYVLIHSANVSVTDSEECADVEGIRVEQILMEATINADVTSLTNGKLTGVLSTHVADCLEASGLMGPSINFGKFLEIAQVTPNLDLDNDGENDAWRFVASFVGTRATNVVSPTE
ncbi:MAG: hypothetical protein CMH54_01620 [Myxococcales bacterium]|nr:hypothetical protein [Myxococcales bacterium]|tara:strand:+ start:61 stop:921 length:861 start_codon:yes stop_codon:yes gene_type:complete